MRINFTRRIGWILLAIWLILTGLAGLGVSFPGLGPILALLAIIAGILILIER